MGTKTKYGSRDVPVEKGEFSRATSGCTGDLILRSHGFEIVDRPRNGEPVWRRKVRGEWSRYTQAEAHAAVLLIETKGDRT